jgi:hypothetical protein
LSTVLATVGRALLLALVVLAALVKLVGVPALRRKHPAAAGALDRHWVWLPVVGVVALVTWAIGWFGLVLGAFAVGVVLARPDAFGLPPR